MKRPASVAFAFSDAPKDQVSFAAAQLTSSPSLPTIRRYHAQSKSSPSYRKASLGRTTPQHRQSTLRRGASYEPTTASAGLASPRPLKRAKTEEWDPAGWQIVGQPQYVAASQEPDIASLNQPWLHRRLLAATYKFVSSVVSTGTSLLATPSTTPAAPSTVAAADVPPLIIKEEQQKPEVDEDVEMVDAEKDTSDTSSIDDEWCIETDTITPVASITVTPVALPVPQNSPEDRRLATPPIPGYTVEQWERLCRYPHLLQKVLSPRAEISRNRHQLYVDAGYSRAANTRFEPMACRRSSPLATEPHIPTEPRIHVRLPRSMSTDRAVRLAQSPFPATTPSRLANYPTCTNKYPGPDRPWSLFRNTVLLNFGDWLKTTNMWVTVRTTGIRAAEAWYSVCGTAQDGEITPDATTPVISSMEPHLDY